MPSYRLSYFNATGFAEVSRLTLAAAGQEWEDIRFKDRDEWLTQKPKYEAGVVPCLEVDGVQISQSQAILRYLGRAHGLDGDEDKPLEFAFVNVILEDLRDFRTELIKWFYEKDEGKKEEIAKTIHDEKRPALVTRLERLLKKNKKSGFFVGSKLTIADIAVFELFDSLSQRPMFADIMMDNEALKEHTKLVKTNEGIAKWLEERPKTES